jgi:hypothetical protein
MVFFGFELNLPHYLLKILSKMAKSYQGYKKNLEHSLFHHGLICILVKHHLDKSGESWDNFILRNRFVLPLNLSMESNPRPVISLPEPVCENGSEQGPVSSLHQDSVFGTSYLHMGNIDSDVVDSILIRVTHSIAKKEKLEGSVMKNDPMSKSEFSLPGHDNEAVDSLKDMIKHNRLKINQLARRFSRACRNRSKKNLIPPKPVIIDLEKQGTTKSSPTPEVGTKGNLKRSPKSEVKTNNSMFDYKDLFLVDCNLKDDPKIEALFWREKYHAVVLVLKCNIVQMELENQQLKLQNQNLISEYERKIRQLRNNNKKETSMNVKASRVNDFVSSDLKNLGC